MSNPLHLFKGYLPTSVIREIENVRDSISPTLNNKIFLHFTNHDVEHSDRMVKILRDVVDENLSFGGSKKLCEDELFILLLSIYLHDIGMQIPEAHGIEKPINELNDEDYNNIRENHGEISADIIKELAQTRKIIHNISVDVTKPMIRNCIDIVCEIIGNHQSKKKYDPSKTIEFSSSKIRIGVLTGLLRLIDQLDCSNNRVEVEKLHQYSIPKVSIMHWVACHFIDSVSVDNGYIKITGSSPDAFPGPYIEFLNKQLIDKINFELESGKKDKTCKSELWKNKIKINFDNKICKQENKYSASRWSALPDWVMEKIQKQITPGLPKYTESKEDEDIEKRDWMSHWGLIGNPFLDHPLAYGSEYLIETEDMQTITSELNQFLKSNKGCIRLLIGERGLGKTTLFQVIKGKFKDQCSVNILDAADIVMSVNTPTELHNKLFERTGAIFGYEDEFDKDNFFDKVNKSKLRIICVDSLDRLPPEKMYILEEFFKQSQYTFNFIMKKIIFIISCAKQWEKFLSSKEINYLSKKNQWVLNKFSTENSKQMLSKRLESSGKTFNDIFDDNCIAPLHAISNSNPREILINTENACRLAFQQRKKKIDIEFLENEYKETLEIAYDNFLKEKCSSDPDFKNGLTAVYWYFLDTDRRNLDRNLGVDFLSQMADYELRHDVSIFKYSVALGFISNRSTKEENGEAIDYYRPKKDVKKFFKTLKINGYTVKDFLSFYSLSPFVPTDHKDDLTQPLNVMDNSSEHIYYHDTARQNYIDVVKGNVGYGYNVYKKSWDALENIIVAILIKIDKLNPHDYVNKKQEVFYNDQYGVQRYRRGAGKILSDHAYELTEKFMKVKKEKKWTFFHKWNSVMWIRNTRNNLLRSPSTAMQNYDDNEQKKLCKAHLGQGYRELEEFYRNVKEQI